MDNQITIKAKNRCYDGYGRYVCYAESAETIEGMDLKLFIGDKRPVKALNLRGGVVSTYEKRTEGDTDYFNVYKDGKEWFTFRIAAGEIVADEHDFEDDVVFTKLEIAECEGYTWDLPE